MSTLPHPNLFGAMLPHPGARHTDPATSHEAAQRKASTSATDAAIVLKCLRVAANNGMTADQIEASLDWPAHAAGKRLSELFKLGLVTRGPATRETRSGSPALIWYHGDLKR